jgi:flavodoxin
MKKNIFLDKRSKTIKKLLKDKKFEIIGEFDCLGHDSNGLFKFIGGINKGRPNKKDKKWAINFAKKIKQNEK